MGKSIYTQRYERFRRLLVKARKDAGLTQDQVAGLLGRPQSHISKCETGERRIDVVELLDLADSVGFDPCKMIRQIRSVKGRRR